MLKLMCVLAHPDDESLAMGGTLAKYASQGVETSLVLATRGEHGWYGLPEAYPGEQALGGRRAQEVRKACNILGVSRLAFLDYIDGELDQADEAEVTAKLVRILRVLRPHVVVTFGPDGLYGHPDHIAISQFTTSAVVCAADANYPLVGPFAPHCVSKLYYRAATSSWLDTYMPIFGELVMRIEGQERRALPWIDWAITTRLDTSTSWRQVWQAVLCHYSQLPPEHVLRNISEDTQKRLWGSQEYYRAYSLVNGGHNQEADLFEGLRTPAYTEPLATLASG